VGIDEMYYLVADDCDGGNTDEREGDHREGEERFRGLGCHTVLLQPARGWIPSEITGLVRAVRGTKESRIWAHIDRCASWLRSSSGAASASDDVKMIDARAAEGFL
jgi:hypothetical protein